MIHDVVIVGGGPAGLSAALALGRARKRVLVADAGPRRNAAAEEMHNFLTRDGTPPAELRRLAREELARYPSVEVRDTRIAAITGERGHFRVGLEAEAVSARRILLATGMVDTMLPIEGFRERWGHAVVQCPYCHGWEVRDRPWGYLAREADLTHTLPFAMQLRGWSKDVAVFTPGFALPAAVADRLLSAGVRVETTPIARLVGPPPHLEAVELGDGRVVPCELLFAHPPQLQVPLVRELGLELDEHGFVRVDPMSRESSQKGIYAAGDLTVRLQAAILAAAAGTLAAAMINVDLAMDSV